MRYLVIGRSIAGITAAGEIRTHDSGAEITIVSEEKGKAYYRPLLPFLIEREEIEVVFPDDTIERHGVKTVYDKVTGLDVAAKEAVLSSGKRLEYDGLLIATGSRAVIPEIPGLRGDGVFPLRTMDDALGIKSFAKGKRRAVVLGGGFVGTKVSSALRHIGLDVTIVERCDQILPQRLDRGGARIIADAIRKAGIGIVLNDSVAEVVREAGAIASVRLSTGTLLDADMVVLAVGARPNIDAFAGSGIRTGKGIITDEALRTNISGVYAAGDVVEYVDLVTGGPAVSALWTNAEEMGRIAGRNMAGASIKYGGFLGVMNATEIMGIPVMSVGLIEPEGGAYEEVVDDAIGTYRKLVFKGDVLMGVVFVGDVAHAGIYTNLIRNRIPIGSLKEEAIHGALGYIHFVSAVPRQTLLT